MQLDSVGDVIAVRKFSLANDPSREIVLKMGKPQPLPDALGDDHYCPFQIIGVGKEKVKYAAGVDAFQSEIWIIETMFYGTAFGKTYLRFEQYENATEVRSFAFNDGKLFGAH